MDEAVKGNGDWIIHVKENWEHAPVAPETDSDVCIFGIAHPLSRLKPEVYIPQVLSIGPYHHRRSPQYEETDTYKLKMASALEKKLHGFEFKMAVELIKSFDGQIRACYHMPIPYNEEDLSWIMALDITFILRFLESIPRPYTIIETDKQLERILDSKRKTPLWYAIKNDLLMLENQLPMFLLIEAQCLRAQYIESDRQVGSESQGKRCLEDLAAMLQAACLHFNPFVRQHPPQTLDLKSTKHVLDYLYHYVTSPGSEAATTKIENDIAKKLASFLEKKPIKKIMTIPRGFNDFFKKMISATTAGNLPSATELREAGIKFAAYDSGDLREISFKRKTTTILLPKITINDSTEAVLRNLVALELNLKTEQKPLTRYTYLMDQLIDTERDVAVLKRCGVLNSQMGSDAEVAQMWNSMSKSTWENTFKPVDEAIEEANKYYSNKWKVMLAQFLKAHCSKPWLVVSVLSAGILLLLTAVQVFCLFYTCNKQS